MITQYEHGIDFTCVFCWLVCICLFDCNVMSVLGSDVIPAENIISMIITMIIHMYQPPS